MPGGPVTIVSPSAGKTSKAAPASGNGGEKQGGGDPPKKPNAAGVKESTQCSKNEVVCPVCGSNGHVATACPTAYKAIYYARMLALGIDPNSFGPDQQARRRRRQGARHPANESNA